MKIDQIAPVFIIIAASLWGVDGIVLRPSLLGLPITLIVLIESSIVTIVLTPIFIGKFYNFKILRLKDWLAFSGVALFGGAIGTMAIIKALFYVNFVNLSIVILIQKLQPLFAILLAAILLKERPPKVFFLWAGLAICGAYIMTFGTKLPNMNTGDKVVAAALFALLASISFGLSTVLSKRALRNIGFELGTYLRFSITAVMMLGIVLFLGEFSAAQNISERQTIVLFLIAFITGGPAIFLYYYGLKRISASVATICELAFPLTAVLLEYVIRGNVLGSFQWLGVFILLISMIKVSLLKLNNSK